MPEPWGARAVMPRLASHMNMLARSLLLAAAFGSVAHAQRTSSLSWVRLVGAETCVSTQALAQQVEARVGRPVFVSASQADLSLEGHVERVAGAWVATLVVSDPQGRVLGRRVLRVTGDRCEALTPSLVLVIAIGIDPEVTLPAAQRPELSDQTKTMLAQLELPKLSEDAVRELAVPDPAAAHGADAGAVSSPPPPAAHTDRSQAVSPLPRAVRVGLHAGAATQFGVMPSPSFGLMLRVLVQTPRLWPIEIAVGGLLPRTLDVPEAGRGRFEFYVVGLGVCSPWGSASRAVFGFRACAGPRAGMLLAQGRGFAQGLSTNGLWADLELHAGPRLQLARGAGWLDVTGSLSLPFVRDRFAYTDHTGTVRSLYRAERLTAGIELGAGIFF